MVVVVLNVFTVSLISWCCVVGLLLGVMWEGGNSLRLGVAMVQVGESRFFGVVFYRLWV